MGKNDRMPKMRNGKPIKSELPGPVARSDTHAQATYAKVHDSAVEQSGHKGDEGYANRAAFAALKHTYEKVGDHWERKDEPGPSDSRAESGGPNPSGEAHGGVDANATKKHLLELAKRLSIKGRSTMDKDELVEAIDRANRRETDRARS